MVVKCWGIMNRHFQLDLLNFIFLIFSLQCAALRLKNKSLKSKISALNSVDS